MLEPLEEEPSHRVLVARVQARDRVEGQVAIMIRERRVGPFQEEEPDRSLRPCAGREVHRRSAAGRDRVDIGAREQQLRDDLGVAPLGGAHEGRERAVCGLRVSTLVEERGDAVAHALARGRD